MTSNTDSIRIHQQGHADALALGAPRSPPVAADPRATTTTKENQTKEKQRRNKEEGRDGGTQAVPEGAPAASQAVPGEQLRAATLTPMATPPVKWHVWEDRVAQQRPPSAAAFLFIIIESTCMAPGQCL